MTSHPETYLRRYPTTDSRSKWRANDQARVKKQEARRNRRHHCKGSVTYMGVKGTPSSALSRPLIFRPATFALRQPSIRGTHSPLTFPERADGSGTIESDQTDGRTTAERKGSWGIFKFGGKGRGVLLRGHPSSTSTQRGRGYTQKRT